MENGLTLKVYKMDYSFLIKNYLNPEMWQKQWTLFEYKNYSVTMNIWSIQTRTEQIILDIRLHYVDGEGYKDYKEQSISFSLKIEDVTFLKRQINSAIFNLIVALEKEQMIHRTSTYTELYESSRDERRKLADIANDFLDENEINNDSIRDAYVSAYIDAYAKIPNMLSDYVDSRIYQELPDVYLTWLSCLEDDPKKEIRIEEIKRALGNDEYKKIMTDIEEYVAHMETEEYEEEMKSNLEEV